MTPTDSTLASADVRLRAGGTAVPRTVASGALLLAVACVLGLVDASVPSLPMAPWLRLGLANLPVVVALCLYGPAMAAVVSLGRVFIVSLATGSLFTPVFMMALAGALASLAVMFLVRAAFGGLSPVGWSAAGSVAHVAGQFAAASFLLGTGGLVTLVPPSMLLALVFGVAVGSLAQLTVSRLPLR